MKGTLNSIIVLLGSLVVVMPAHSEPVLITDIDVSRSTDSASTDENYSIDISGLLPDPIHSLVADPVLRRNNNDFEVDLMIDRVSPIFGEDLLVSAVVVPFSSSVQLGMLEEGIYSAKINYFLSGSLSESMDHVFSTESPAIAATHAPLPPAIWLLAGGLCSLIMLKRRVR